MCPATRRWRRVDGRQGRRGNANGAINQTQPLGRLNTREPGYLRHQPVIRHVNRQSISWCDMITFCPPLLLVFLPLSTPWTSICLVRPFLTSINLFLSLVRCGLLTVTYAQAYKSTFLHITVLAWCLFFSKHVKGIDFSLMG